MSFDNSRLMFDPWRDYFGVVMQQGRVQLDSDWNEWVAELARRLQAGTMDILGLAGVPSTTPAAFKIAVVADTQAPHTLHLMIGTGRIYVDGILAENHGARAAAQWDFALEEMSGSPQPPVSPGSAIDYAQQPWPPPATFPPAGKGPFLVYLDVWLRPVTFLEDPNLIEKAVGVDSTGRYQTVWQVKWLDVSSVPGVACSTPVDAWTGLLTPSGSLLTTGTANLPSSSLGPCSLSTGLAYSGLENQLYRVEIHRSGAAASYPVPVALPAGTATFKWSRENASVATAITSITTANNSIKLAVQSLGKDQVLGFHPGDWIELTSDSLQFNSQAGPLYQIDSIDAAAGTINLASSSTSSGSVLNYTRIVRWDQAGAVYLSDGVTVWWDLNAVGSTGDIPVPPHGTTLLLENGVTVAFDLAASSAASFSSGDFWSFAARTADGSVEPLTQAAPLGIHHHHCRLAMVDLTGSSPVVSDCRQLFPALANPAIHVKSVSMQGVPLPNDGNTTFQQLAAGISVVCDLPLDPGILTQPAAQPNCPIFSLTVDIPSVSPTGAPASGPAGIGFSSIVIPAASVTISPPNTITWTPSPIAMTALEALPAGQPLLARLTLKGNSIWALGNPNVYLNGATVSQPSTGLRLPTGDGRPSADFHMWFWLNTQPLLTLSPNPMSFAAQSVKTTSPVQNLALKNNGLPLTFDPSRPVTITGDAAAEFAITSSFTSPLPTGGTGTIAVTFTPLARAGRLAQMNIPESRDASALVVPLQGIGTAPQIVPFPVDLAFPVNQTVNVASPAQTLTLTNNGNAPLTISGMSLQPNTNYTFSPSSPLPITLPEGQPCTVQVLFVPASTGSKPASLAIAHNDPTAAANPLLIPLSGTGSAGVAGFDPVPTGLGFPIPTDGQVSATVVLHSNGTAPLIIAQPVISGPAAKSVFITSIVPAVGASLQSGATCTITLSTSGVIQTVNTQRTAVLTIAHNAPVAPIVVNITLPVVKTGS